MFKLIEFVLVLITTTYNIFYNKKKDFHKGFYSRISLFTNQNYYFIEIKRLHIYIYIIDARLPFAYIYISFFYILYMLCVIY